MNENSYWQRMQLGRARLSRRTLLKGAVIAGGAVVVQGTGLGRIGSVRAASNTKAPPYLVPLANGVDFTPLVTTGDVVGGNYKMVGIPDGLGAYNNADGTFSLVMNHEIVGTAGAVRAHGSRGSMVSRFKISKTLEVVSGEDLINSPQHVHQWDAAKGAYFEGTTVWQRFCSADLPKPGALANGGEGTTEKIYLNGEEVAEGRGWAHIATGPYAGHSWQLPRFGNLSYENIVLNPSAGNLTIGIASDDSSLPGVTPTSEVYVYIGNKQDSGALPIDRAGLTNGSLYGIAISRANGTPVAAEDDVYGLGNANTGYIGAGRFDLVKLGNGGDVSKMSPAEMQTDSTARGVTQLQRPEDSCWDPRPGRSGDFYQVTTASFTQNSRLWRFRFDDITRPTAGGTVDILLRGNEGHKMLDNITIDMSGRIVMQEDPGAQNYIARIWIYDIDSRKFTPIGIHNPRLFDPAANSPDFITNDEESSGVIDATDVLGAGWFLLDVQAHKVSEDTTLVEGGQLLAMYAAPWVGK